MTTKSGSISLTKISWLQTKPLWGFPAGLASDSPLGATTLTQRDSGLSEGWDCEDGGIKHLRFWTESYTEELGSTKAFGGSLMA